MSRELGLTQDWPVVIVGLGNLGQALANYGGFGERGFPVAALVDADPTEVVGTDGARHRRPPHRRPARHRRPSTSIAIGIIATPGRRRPGGGRPARRRRRRRRSSTSRPTVISVPEEVSLRKVDLAVELQILSFYQQRTGRRCRRVAARRRLTAAVPVDVPAYPVNLLVAGRRVLVVGGGRGGRGEGARACSTPAPSCTSWRPRSRAEVARPRRDLGASGPYRRGEVGRLPPGGRRHRRPGGQPGGLRRRRGGRRVGQRRRRPGALLATRCRPGSPGPAARHGVHRRAQPGAGGLAPRPARRRSSGPSTTTCSSCSPRPERSCVAAAGRPTEAPIGERPSIRGCWTSSGRSTDEARDSAAALATPTPRSPLGAAACLSSSSG